MKDINQVLKRVKISLYWLIFILALLTSYLMLLLRDSSDELNTVSNSISQSMLEKVIDKELEILGALVKDYSIWNDAVSYLILEQNQEFLRDNFNGEHLQENFGVLFVDVYGVDRQNLLSFSYTKPEQNQERLMRKQIAYQPLMKSEYPFPLIDATIIHPSLGFISSDQQVFMAACSIIKPHNETDEELVLTQVYGFLCMSKVIDETLLSEWENTFYFKKLSFEKQTDQKERHLTHVIKSPVGETLATLTWQAEQPGVAFLNDRLAIVIALIIAMGLVTFFFVFTMHRYIGMGHEIAQIIDENSKALTKLANEDNVTGLVNRRYMLEMLTENIDKNASTSELTAILFIDLDNFKPVNDNFGHDMGDKLLISIAKRLLSCVSKNDLVARYAGDEFLMAVQVDNLRDIDTIAQRVLDVISKAFVHDEMDAEVSASIGISIAPLQGNNVKSLITMADQAMYKSKANGGNQYSYFEV